MQIRNPGQRHASVSILVVGSCAAFLLAIATFAPSAERTLQMLDALHALDRTLQWDPKQVADGLPWPADLADGEFNHAQALLSPLASSEVGAARGQALLDSVTGRWEAAIGRLEQGTINSSNNQILALTAATILEANRPNSGTFTPSMAAAEASAWRSVSLTPQDFIHLGDLLIEMEQPRRAVVWLERGTHGYPENRELWYHLGNLQHALGNLDQASQAFRQGLAAVPSTVLGSSNFLYRLALLQLAAGTPDSTRAAQQLLQQALRTADFGTATADQADTYFQLGHVFYHQGQYAAALAYYRDSLTIEPNFYYAWLSTAATLLQLGRADDAVDSINHAISLRPEQVDGFLWLADLYRRQGRLALASRQIDHALALEPDNAVAVAAKADLEHWGGVLPVIGHSLP